MRKHIRLHRIEAGQYLYGPWTIRHIPMRVGGQRTWTLYRESENGWRPCSTQRHDPTGLYGTLAECRELVEQWADAVAAGVHPGAPGTGG